MKLGLRVWAVTSGLIGTMKVNNFLPGLMYVPPNLFLHEIRKLLFDRSEVEKRRCIPRL